MAKKYTFGEKPMEFSPKEGKEVPVWISPQYERSKKKVIEMLESDQYKDVIDESDFWILMNATKSGKMAYTGLIISHNGCLKINDALPDDLKFKSGSMYIEKEGWNGSLVFIYQNDDQGIFECGEVSPANCRNNYPYAMALKRCMDRVILKNSKLAYAGVYSDSEADEFKKPEAPEASATPPKAAVDENIDYKDALTDICQRYNLNMKPIAAKYKLNSKSSQQDFYDAYMEIKNEVGE